MTEIMKSATKSKVLVAFLCQNLKFLVEIQNHIGEKEIKEAMKKVYASGANRLLKIFLAIEFFGQRN